MKTLRATVFSSCYRYRYTLYRKLDGGDRQRGMLVFILLNPSTADSKKNDPTVRRCIGYGEAWGFSELQVLNLFALRSTDPKELYRARNPVGKENDHWIKRVIYGGADLIVCAWGTHGGLDDRDLELHELLLPFGTYCLDTTKGGFPRHPLYAPGYLTPRGYQGQLVRLADNAGEAMEAYKAGRRAGKRIQRAAGADSGPA